MRLLTRSSHFSRGDTQHKVSTEQELISIVESRTSGESGSEGLPRGAALSAERKLLERVPAGGNSQAVALRLKVGGRGGVDWARPRRFLGPGERRGLSQSASLCALSASISLKMTVRGRDETEM